MAVVVRYEVPESLNVRVRRMKFVAIPLNVLISVSNDILLAPFSNKHELGQF